jgi:hypothetical protein
MFGRSAAAFGAAQIGDFAVVCEGFVGRDFSRDIES